MNKKIGIILISIIILGIISTVTLKDVFNKNQTKMIKQTTNDIKMSSNYLLDGFPINKIPLYKQNKISSSKIFVNTDSKNTSPFGEKNFAYYNVVFGTDANQEDFLSYYKSIFDSQIKEEYESPEMVKGVIGEYKITAANYGDNTGYLQVYLSDYKDESINKYFIDFPEILKTNSVIVEHEKSFGLLNQKNGEIEFTKYFTVVDSGDTNKDGKDDIDEFLQLETDYEGQYKEKTEYSYDKKTGIMKWKDRDFEVSLTLSKNHNRIYLMLRKSLNK